MASQVLPPPVGTFSTAFGTDRSQPSMRGENGIAARDVGSLPTFFSASHASLAKSGMARPRSGFSAASLAILSDRAFLCSRRSR